MSHPNTANQAAPADSLRLTARPRNPVELLASIGRRALYAHRGLSETYRRARLIEHNMRRSADELRVEQDRLIAAIVDHAYKCSPFYRRRFSAVGFRPGDVRGCADLPLLPTVRKEDLVRNINDILCLPRHELSANTTGGTTGIAFQFYRDRNCLMTRQGIDLAVLRYYGWRDGQWQGWLWGATRDMVLPPTSLKGRLARHLGDRQFFFDASCITTDAYRRFAELVRRRRPTIVSAYPSLAYDLACRIESGEVEPVRVPVVTTTAEPTYDFQRAKIREFLADEVFERYGSRETGMAAIECPAHDGMHCFTESVFFETRRDADNLPARHLFVTDLLNYGMPFIRYDAGDCGDIDETPCACGRVAPRLKHVSGRVVETVWSPDGHGTSGMMVVSCVRRAQIHVPVQIVQDRLDHLTVRVEDQTGTWAAELRRLIAMVAAEISPAITADVEWTPKISRSPAGKYQYVISRVNCPKLEERSH